MLSIWIGRAGAGKSRRVLETMARQRSQRPQVLLVPEHISHEAEVDLCRALGPTASRDAEVLSFQSLGSRVLAQTGGLAEFTLDGGGKLLTMRLALQELHSRLKVFGRPSQRAAFLRQLTDLTEEFYAYEITPQALWQQVEDMEGAMGDKLRDLALLYAAYDGKLHAEGVDARSRLQKLRDRLAESDYLRGKDVYLDGFSYLNKLEESVLEQVMRQAESVTVTLLGDRAEGTLFQNALRQRQRLERMARQLGTECEIVWLTGSGKGPLAHLEKHLLGENCGFFESIPLWAVTLIGGLFITVLSFIMIMTVYGRFFKLYLYTAIAPVPLSAFAGEPSQNIGKSFIKSYAAVCLEGAIIVLACIIFSLFASSPPVVDPDAAAVTQVWSYVGELIFNMLVLVSAVKMADRVVREMMGL